MTSPRSLLAALIDKLRGCIVHGEAEEAPVTTTANPVDAGAAHLLVEDDDIEGAGVLAVLISPEGRVIAQRRTVVGGEK